MFSIACGINSIFLKKGDIMAKTMESPGTFLAHMLEKYKLNPFKISKDINLSQSAVRLIVLDETRISVPVALRRAKYFNTNPEFWLSMQMKWDLAQAAKDKSLMNVIKGISRFKKEQAGGAKSSAKKTTGKKPAAKKPSARKPAAKKVAAKKPVAKKAVAKKPAVKKFADKRPVAKKTASKATAARAEKKPAAAKAKKTSGRRSPKK
jgi:addiction module HigA family antidote